jgi:hypothetical protein
MSNKAIRDDLQLMGVVSWAPLFDDGSEESKMDIRLRCRCRSKSDLSNIMLKYFTNGKRYKTDQNFTLTLTLAFKSPTKINSPTESR